MDTKPKIRENYFQKVLQRYFKITKYLGSFIESALNKRNNIARPEQTLVILNVACKVRVEGSRFAY